jgi:hypothetical protein
MPRILEIGAALTLCAAAPWLFPSPALALSQGQEALDERAIASALSSAERRIESAASALEDYQAASPLAKPRHADRFARGVERTLEALEPLQGTGRDTELRARLAGLQAEFDTAAQATAAVAGTEDEAQARLDAWRESGELAADAQALEAMQQVLTNASRFSASNGLFTRNGDPASLEQFIADVANWRETLAAFEPLAQKYESLGQRVFFRATGAAAAIRDIRARLLQSEAAMVRFKTEAPGDMEAGMDEAEALARSAVREGRFSVFTGLNAPMRMALIMPEGVTGLYEALPITSDAEAAMLRARFDARMATINALKGEASQSIISQNRLPPTGYAGGDAASILAAARAGFEAIHGRRDVIELRIPQGQWTRRQGWSWQRAARGYERYDYSVVDVYVIERTSASVATFWRVSVHKKHLEGDALIADPASRTRHTPTPDQQILIANL